MSDLQLGLIVIGVLIVGGVFLFNRYQEQQFRKRMEHAFRDRPEDVLLAAEADAGREEERREPRFAPEAARSATVEEQSMEAVEPDVVRAAPQPVAPTSEPPPEQPGAAIDYVCELRADQPIAHEVLEEFLRAVRAIGKPVVCLGWRTDQAAWITPPGPANAQIAGVRAALQLADRNGPANRVQIAQLRDLVTDLAKRVDGSCTCPEIDSAAESAVALDRFCAEVDVSVGFSVVPRTGAGFAGTKLRGLLEAAGFTLDESGRFCQRGEHGRVVLTVDHIDARPFTAEALRNAPVSGVTLLMDVPRVAERMRAFDRMVELGRNLAETLDGSLVDDNRAPLSDAGLQKIRQQLRSIYAAMDQRNLEAGGTMALRLFS